VCFTTLDNPAMPLVRYGVGDLAVAGDGAACPCGRPEPILPEVIGRAMDLFYFRSGPKSPWGVVARMREISFLRRFQLVQTDIDTVQVRVQSTGRGPLDHEEMRKLVTSEMGDDIRVMIQKTDDFPRLPSGKFAPALRLYQPSAR
jgi:phenylacetate-CoA ligase